MNLVLDEIHRTGRCKDARGQERKVTGAISREDAQLLADLVKFARARTTLETGVAFGLSTLAICSALRERNEPGVRHIGIDPDQTEEHGNAALANLQLAGLDDLFELLGGPSHIELPRLLERKLGIDLAFIDGWHTFDYALLDFFYIDKLLRPGGLVLFHDASWPAVRKVTRFVVSHRRYVRLLARLRPPVPLGLRLRRGAAAAWHSLRGSPFSLVASGLLGRSEIAVLQKLETWEPPHLFFRRF